MYWKYGSGRIQTVNIPFLVLGEDYDVTLTLVTESGENLEKVYLCVVDQNHIDLIEAKLSTGSTYKGIAGLRNPQCYLGDLTESTETDIDFRLSFPVTESAALKSVAILLAHGDHVVVSGDFYWSNLTDEFFVDDLTEPFFSDS